MQAHRKSSKYRAYMSPHKLFCVYILATSLVFLRACQRWEWVGLRLFCLFLGLFSSCSVAMPNFKMKVITLSYYIFLFIYYVNLFSLHLNHRFPSSLPSPSLSIPFRILLYFILSCLVIFLEVCSFPVKDRKRYRSGGKGRQRGPGKYRGQGSYSQIILSEKIIHFQ